MEIRVIIGAEKNRSKLFRTLLEQNGMTVLAEINDDATLLRKLHSVYPDIILIDSSIKGERPIDLVNMVIEYQIGQVLAVVTETEKADFLELTKTNVFELVVKPTSRKDFVDKIHDLAQKGERIFNHKKVVLDQAASQQVVDRAKRILMTKMKLSEQEAYVRIRQQSMNKGLPKSIIAQEIIRIFS